MHTQPRPTFNLSDAVALVGGTAAALAATRATWPMFWDVLKPGAGFPGDFPTRIYLVRSGTDGKSFFFAAWALACLWRGARRPKPELADLMRQPGVVTCTTAAIVLGIRMVNLGISLAVSATQTPWPATWWAYVEEEGVLLI